MSINDIASLAFHGDEAQTQISLHTTGASQTN